MGTLKTIVADGNEIFRHGLSSILTEDGFTICSELDNGALVLSAYEDVSPSLCVLSFNLPEIDGIQLADKIQQKDTHAQILVLADDSSEETLAQFLDSGANGLLLKSADRIEFLDACRKIAAGDTYLGKQFSKMMTREFLRISRSRKLSRPQITPREKEVLSYLVKGYTSTEIANELYISSRTVDKHRTNLLQKLGLKNTASLVRYALKSDDVRP
jgi:DNA-binding NarL/FixJ family response regulator